MSPLNMDRTMLSTFLGFLSERPHIEGKQLAARLAANGISSCIRRQLEKDCCQICGTSGRGTRKKSYLDSDRLCNLCFSWQSNEMRRLPTYKYDLRAEHF